MTQYEDVEKQTLLPATETKKGSLPAVVDASEEARQEWHGHFCNCFGDCSLSAFGTFFVVLFAPYIAFGHNMRRAFGKCGWKHGLLFFAVCMFLPRMLSNASQLTYQLLVKDPACFPPPPGPHDLHHPHGLPRPEEGLPTGDFIDLTDVKLGGTDGRFGPADALGVADGPPHDCRAPVMAVMLALMAAAVYVAGLVMVIRRRTQMRQKFGITGSRCGDCLAWTYCAPCALCQETRTLMHNNVEGGSWHGPTVAVTTMSGAVMTPEGVLAPPVQQVATGLPIVKEV